MSFTINTAYRTDENQDAELFGVVLKDPDLAPSTVIRMRKVAQAFPLIQCARSLARHLLTDSEITSGTFWVEADDDVKSL